MGGCTIRLHMIEIFVKKWAGPLNKWFYEKLSSLCIKIFVPLKTFKGVLKLVE
jgi:hypothetical protein